MASVQCAHTSATNAIANGEQNGLLLLEFRILERTKYVTNRVLDEVATIETSFLFFCPNHSAQGKFMTSSSITTKPKNL